MFSIRLFKEEISCVLQVLHSSLLFPRTLKLTMCLLGNGTATLVSSGVAVVKKLFLFSSLPVFGAYSLQMFWTTTICNILLQNLPSHFLVILLPLWGGKFDFFQFFSPSVYIIHFFFVCLFGFCFLQKILWWHYQNTVGKNTFESGL